MSIAAPLSFVPFIVEALAARAARPHDRDDLGRAAVGGIHAFLSKVAEALGSLLSESAEEKPAKRAPSRLGSKNA